MTGTILVAPEEAVRLAPAPGSVTWRLAGDVRMLAGAGYALLLQVSHPVVGAGVAEHSDYRRDPWGRLWRTLDYVNLSVFGGPQAAAEVGRRTRELHRRIRGTRPDGVRYHALEPAAFAWVHATLAHSMLRANALLAAPPTPWEQEVFYAEWRRLGRLVGVRERDLPAGLGAFRRYVEATIADTLEDNPTVQGVLDTILRPARPDVAPLLPETAWRALRIPAAHAARVLTGGLLGPRLRERFGLGWSSADEAQLRVLSAVSRAAGPALPRGLRLYGPAYLERRREAIRAAGIVP
jgi:uncharacterized protein (DUF2236 family)